MADTPNASMLKVCSFCEERAARPGSRLCGECTDLADAALNDIFGSEEATNDFVADLVTESARKVQNNG